MTILGSTKYHIVWTTKYRYTMLGRGGWNQCREQLREIARSKEMRISVGSINRDRVHMLISIPPQLSLSKAVQYLKGKGRVPISCYRSKAI